MGHTAYRIEASDTLYNGDGPGGQRFLKPGSQSLLPSRRSSPKILHRAWELRWQMTPVETRLWMYLRTLRAQGVHFRRQHAMGPYVTDFCEPGYRLVIELDGSQHLDHEERDKERTAYLSAQAYRVIRFWNDRVMNDVEGVMRAIRLALGQK